MDENLFPNSSISLLPSYLFTLFRVEKNLKATAVEVKLSVVSDKIDSDGQTNFVFTGELQFCILLD